MHHLRQYWIRIRSSLWFVPLAMVLGAIVLAVLLILADVAVGADWIGGHSLLFGVGAAGARGMLSAIAGSMMTVASLTFTLTISTLATASSQYTSRLIRHFMRDRLNQFVLGYFVGLFGYCLIVLRTIRSGEEGAFVPSLAVMGGLLLALLSIGVLIFFIHHIASSIQAGTILERVTADTLRAIDELFPADLGEAKMPALTTPGPTSLDPSQSADEAIPSQSRWHAVPAGRFGYVESVDAKGLLAIAAEIDSVIRMIADIGAFVTPAGSLCEIALPSPPEEALVTRLRGAFDIGGSRTIEQDAAFGIRQIVDIALKALSPGINDTTTGVMCVDHLAVVLERIAARPIPDRLRAEDGVIRFIGSGRSFDVLAGLCLNQIRQSASGNTAVMTALLSAIAAAGRQASDPDRRQTLSRHARLIAELARKSLTCSDDLDPVRIMAAETSAELDTRA
ncbi:MAG: DUF2254 domain-containing protein [Phycisphaerales bacterium]|nr:DUF2254 domain-containing protein [Phycisphaerales bacterium]